MTKPHVSRLSIIHTTCLGNIRKYLLPKNHIYSGVVCLMSTRRYARHHSKNMLDADAITKTTVLLTPEGKRKHGKT